ncbi:hypothetical protein RND81_11G052200 [Saponaria officinalis]|uniref:Pentatricopeptide repeat-containing protein n=1 Tax=Saponaria officinalis TaxID=3572 RepID=A0AAW1HI26_SAPOF
MLYSLHQWRHCHRLAYPLSKLTISSPVAAKFFDEPPIPLTVPPSTNIADEILYGLRSYGTHKFLSGSYFRHSLSCKLDVDITNQVVERLVFERPELAVGFYSVLKRDHGFQHSRKCGFVVAHVLARSRQVKELRELIMDIIHEEGLDSAHSLSEFLANNFSGWDSNCLVWDMLIFCYSRVEMLSDALVVLTTMKDLNMQPSIFTYNSLLQNLKNTAIIWEVYDELKVSGIIKNTYTDPIIIDGLCKQSMLQRAVDFWRATEKGGASIVSFNTLMSSFCGIGHVDVAKSFLCMMLKYGLIPDTYTYNILIHGLCTAGLMEEALQLADNMEKYGVEPDIVTYNTLVKGFHLLGLGAGTDQILRKMMMKGLNPNIITYNILLCGYCQTGKVEDTIRLLHEMVTNGLPLNIISYSILCSCLSKMGQLDKAMTLLADMETTGVKPDVIFYSILIHGLCKIGEVEKAIQLCNDMYTRNMFPSSFTHGSILSGLFDYGMVTEARLYFDSLTNEAKSFPWPEDCLRQFELMDLHQIRSPIPPLWTATTMTEINVLCLNCFRKWWQLM